MHTEQLLRMRKDKGFIAALDQSGGSTPKALELYGISKDSYATEKEMYTLVHAMRERVMTCPSFNQTYILGAILFEDTVNRSVEGEAAAAYLWKRKKIVPFLKIDNGLAERKNGVQRMRPIPELEETLHRAVAKKIFGTKMRSVIWEPDPVGIAELVAQQFAFAERIAAAGLVPIIEPEVDIHSPGKHMSEKLLKEEVHKHLSRFGKEVSVMFKFSIPVEDNFYADLLDDPRVVRVVALSGGYTQAEANMRIARNHGVIASFSRALLEGLSASQSDDQFNATLSASIQAIYTASIT